MAEALRVIVVACLAPRQVREWGLELQMGATVQDALSACGMVVPDEDSGTDAPAVGIWGRAAGLETPLKDQDRVEVYRPLKVDPKVARRERFARQGARSSGLFARQRPGGKAGY